MNSILLVSSARGAGKSTVLAALMQMLAANGTKVIGTKLYLEGTSDTFLSAQITKELPEVRSPAPLPKGGVAQLSGELAALSKGQVLVAEGVSGKPEHNLELAKKLDMAVVLVATYGEDLAKQVAFYGKQLRAIVVNKVPRYKRWEIEQSAGAYSDLAVPIIAAVPEERLLTAPYFSAVLDAIGGEHIVGGNPAECVIENYLIGGRVLDWGPSYFSSRENTLVIVAGDRPDIQLAALQTESTAAMVSTKGIAPIEYVYYEARQQNIPLAVVNSSTSDVAKQLSESVLDYKFDSSKKLARVVALLTEQMDLSAITNLTASAVAK